MAQWGQGQPGYQYPLQTGFQNQNPAFQQQGYPQGGLAPQPTGFAAQRPPGFQQPQQTGYPGGVQGLVPQQTGFSGLAGGFNQQQQRPPIPPVPPIPSQYGQQQQLQQSGFLGAQQQQPGRFLSPSPALGGPGLAPQPTGFPGRVGGGLQPLVPQVTGFIDPRLQMMSSTFLPANQSSPYNAAGAPQLFQPQQQLGGLSLQQSFQQHNQEVKGTAAPRVPWALSKGEKKSYDQIFRAWDASGTGFIDGGTAIEVFGQSGLGKDDLARIWTLADGDNRGKLNMAEFHVAMGLIYRKLNGNEIPDELPPELVPPSHRDLDTSITFLKDVLKNDARARSPGNLDAPVSRMKERSFMSSGAPGAGGRQDATVYKHTDSEAPGSYYTPRNRQFDRNTVRTERERDNPASDLSDMKRQLENTAKMLDRVADDNANRTAEDDALEREMRDLQRRVKHVQEDLEYYTRGPRSARTDEERRKLERELLHLMHEEVPAVEKKIQEREERKEREKRDWDRERDKRNDRFGRFDDRDREYGSYSRDGDRDRDKYDRYDRDRERDRDRDYGRDRSYRERSHSRERTRDYDRPRSPPAARSPPPPPPPVAPSSSISKPPPPPPAPNASPAPSTKNMTPEERKAFIREQAERRMAERMAALGVTPLPGSGGSRLDTSVEDRLAREKKEAEEKAREAEKAAEEREKARRERLEGEKAVKEGRTPPASVPSTPVVAKPPAPPPPKPRAPAPPPPRKAPAPRAPTAPPVSAPVPPPAPPAPPVPVVSEVDPEEERLKAREEALRKQREERLARFRQLEQEEEEERQREEELLRRRSEEAARRTKDTEEQRKKEEREARIRQMELEEAEEQRKAEEEFARRKEARSRASTPAPSMAAPSNDPAPPAPPPPPPPPVPPIPASSIGSPADKAKHNPFNRLASSGSAAASPAAASPMSGSTNPFFKPQTQPAPASPAAFSVPAPPKSPVPAKSSYQTAPADSDEDWGDVREKEENDSDSEDELDSSRATRNRLAQQLFGSILPPARPQSAAGAGAGATPKPGSPFAPTPPPPPPSAPPASVPQTADSGAPPPPPPPPPPGAPPPPAVMAAPMAAPTPAPAGERNALLSAIQSGARLRKAATNDRSSSSVSGRVIGDTAPPPHINAAPTPVSPASPDSPVDGSRLVQRENSRLSVDWYSGMAADHGVPLSREPSGLDKMAEEDEQDSESESLPNIQVDIIEESNPLDDVDKATEFRTRSLYAYEGQRPEDLSFGENLVLTAHPSKSGGDWWYGTVVRDGKSGFFPKTYVQSFESVKAKAVYSYTGGNADELPFVEGDTLSIVDKSEGDWWKAEQGGVVFIVPAAYLELVEAHRKSSLPSTPEASTMTSADRTSLSELVSGDDSSDSEYLSFSDSDDEDEGQTEAQRKADREARVLERQRVLEAAGLIVKEDGRRPPPRPVRRKAVLASPGKKSRPPPPVPSSPANRVSVISTASDKDLPPVPDGDRDRDRPTRDEFARLDDAFGRYEAFKLATGEGINNRLSIASSVESSSLSPVPSSPQSLRHTKSQESENRSHSSWLHILGRSRTPVGEERRVMPIISGPILSNESTPVRENSPTFGSSWASLVDKSALDEIPQRERRRQEAIFEFIATEGAYVRDLQLIVEIFYASMLSILEQKEVTVIFANVEDILLTNTTFLSSLEERQRNCRLYIDQIGDILDQNMSNMQVYGEYCSNHSQSIKALQSLREINPALGAHLQKLREDPTIRNLDLSSYLLEPMQRITRYPLLIKQILHYTDPDQDRKATERALRTAEQILSHINENIREQEGRERLRVLSQDLWIGQGRLDLTAPTRHMGERRLIKEGPLSKTKSGKKLRAFLCSDILVLTDEQAKSLYRMPIPLYEVHVRELPGSRDDLAFQLVIAYPRGGDKIALRAPSARDCHMWMADIDIASQTCRDAERRAARNSARRSIS